MEEFFCENCESGEFYDFIFAARESLIEKMIQEIEEESAKCLVSAWLPTHDLLRTKGGRETPLFYTYHPTPFTIDNSPVRICARVLLAVASFSMK